MAVTTPAPDIATQRRQLEARRRELTARRPAVALAAAGGDPAAVQAARDLADELTGITARLEDLTLAEREEQRLAEERRAEQARIARDGLLLARSGARRELSAALGDLERLLAALGAQLATVRDRARQVDALAADLGQQPYAEPACRGRVAGRILAVAAAWPLPLAGQPDTRPLGADDAGR